MAYFGSGVVTPLTCQSIATISRIGHRRAGGDTFAAIGLGDRAGERREAAVGDLGLDFLDLGHRVGRDIRVPVDHLDDLVGDAEEGIGALEGAGEMGVDRGLEEGRPIGRDAAEIGLRAHISSSTN